MLDWLIVGGGIHGTHLSHYLTHRKRIPRDRVRVLDPHPEPLALWDRFTANTGMEYLRSSHVHNLNYDVWSLRTFAESLAGQPLARFIPIYNRPALDLFRAHSAWLIDRHKLRALRLTGRASGLTRHNGNWRIETPDGGIEAHNVVLAIGAGEQPHIPDWAQAGGMPIQHVFAPDFDREALPPWSDIVVIGGGITAVQTAIALADTRPATVTLLARHSLRIHHFDSDPCWVTRICLDDFHAQPDFDQRRAMLNAARNRGSVPPDVADALRGAVEAGMVRRLTAEVMQADPVNQGVRLTLTSGDTLHTDRVILATGFDAARPGGDWLDAAVAACDLPVAGDGYPVVDAALRWADGLHVSGPLAELEVGPVSRNIVGARLAAERIGTVVG